jgi:hypothetical protein
MVQPVVRLDETAARPITFPQISVAGAASAAKFRGPRQALC